MAIAQLGFRPRSSPSWTGFDGLVQLISVDGQRTVGCPYWDLVADVDAAPAARPLPRHGDRPPARCRGDGAAAPGRARPVGAAARAGGGAGRLGPRSAARRLRRSRATASTASPTAAASTRSTCCACGGAPACSGWDPAELRHRHPGHHRGLPGPARHRLRAGLTLDGADSAVVAYFGDGASSEGDVAEALGFAASYMVPVVFFCQNNQWAISEPVRLQSHASIAQRGQGYGIPGIQVDGNDVLAVLAATRLALARAYAGQGPTLIEAVTYRMGPHTTSDDPTRYRSRAEEEEWRAKDPLGPAARAARSARAWPTTASSDEVDGRGGRRGRRAARGRARHARPRARRRCSTTSTPSRTRCSTRS